MKGIYLKSKKQIKCLLENGMVFLLKSVTSKFTSGVVKIWDGSKFDKTKRKVIGRGFLEFVDTIYVYPEREDDKQVVYVYPPDVVEWTKLSGFSSVKEWLEFEGVKLTLRKPKKMNVFVLYLKKIARRYREVIGFE